MKILLLNQTWFSEEFRAAGHEVLCCGFSRDFDVKLTQPFQHIDLLIQTLPNSFSPDVIVVYDESSPLLVSGLDETSIPTLFYSVDTHHHWELHRYFGHLFDATLVAQKDHLHHFEALGVRAQWMPLWASRFVEASSEKKYMTAFVGTMDRRLNPERVAFFEALAQKVPIELMHGQYWTIFPHSEIVVNQTVKGDLNFRVFEAMMCGTMLLTEHSANGLLELFQDGVHLVTYAKGSVDQAAEIIARYQNNLSACRAIAQAGREAILSHHLTSHRAHMVLGLLESLRKTDLPMRSFAAMMNFNCLAANLVEREPAQAARALVCALRAAEIALQRKEFMTLDGALHLVICALRYDRLAFSRAGAELLHQAGEQYPQFNLVTLARVRDLLNRGEQERATVLAQRFSEEDVATVFGTAETVITKLLAEMAAG